MAAHIHSELFTERPSRVLLFFVDGLGLPHSNVLRKSIFAEFPILCELLQSHAVPLATHLNVSGTPQSATGQTTILTGTNACALTGRPLSGFPTRPLRRCLESENIFLKLQNYDCQATFANAYVRRHERSLQRNLQSATTIATLSAFGRTRTADDLLRGNALYHDLTRWTLVDHAGVEDVPRITQQEAARHLMNVFRQHQFCLFEYFLTDVYGHRGTLDQKKAILRSIEEHVRHLFEQRQEDELIMIVSDHGNIEEPDHKYHTRNSVPLVALGPGRDTLFRECRSLTDITPLIVQLLTA